MTVIGVSYAYLYTSLSIKGTVSGTNSDVDYVIDPNSNPNLAIDKFKINNWEESGLYKRQYQFDIVNNGKETYDNFKITIIFSNDIEDVNLWNYDYDLNGNTLTVTNNKYDLKPHNKLNVGFIISSNYTNTKIINMRLDVKEQGEEIDLDQFNVVFTNTNGWGHYVYQYDVTITNKTGSSINAWQIEITLPTNTSYKSGWNAVFNTQDNILIIKNASYNGRLDNNASTTFGLQLNTDIINYVPNNIKVTVR